MAETHAQTLTRVEKKIKALEIKVANEAFLLGTRHEVYKRDKQSLESCKQILEELKVEFAAEENKNA
jgi:phosphate uptake regulator